MNFLAGFFLGFSLCFIMAYNHCSNASNKLNKIKALEMQNARLINALRYSGGRISFYKTMNESHLKKIMHSQNQKEKILQLLRS